MQGIGERIRSPHRAGNIAFTIERNNHAEFGGSLQLILSDFLSSVAAASTAATNA